MDKQRLQALLQSVANGEITAQEAAEALRHLPYQELGFAKVDFHRAIRQGLPEVIFCPGKTAQQIIEIARTMKDNHSVVVATRSSADIAETVISAVPGGRYDPLSRLIIWGTAPPVVNDTFVAVIAAGTADLPVAAEAAEFLAAAGIETRKLYDVGVAGVHRILSNIEAFDKASVVIVVAGMDGALPSVVGGLVSCPVIAVPTSVGYGSHFQGLAPLLTMLNSCAAGLTVVNIDNGFGAAVAAIRIVMQIKTRDSAGVSHSEAES